MSTKRFVLDPTDDWGRIPSHLLDRGTFFSSPDPSEEGLLVDEEFDQENIWDRQGEPSPPFITELNTWVPTSPEKEAAKPKGFIKLTKKHKFLENEVITASVNPRFRCEVKLRMLELSQDLLRYCQRVIKNRRISGQKLEQFGDGGERDISLIESGSVDQSQDVGKKKKRKVKRKRERKGTV